MLDQTFGPVSLWPHQDLIGFSTEFDADLVLSGYRSGVFPMPLSGGDFGGEMGWWSPMERGILPIDGVRVTRSLRQSVRRYSTTVDVAFDEVLAQCAKPDRPGGWIDHDIVEVYTQLQRSGFVHSVETWDEKGRLVGGLYGVSLGGMFAGESMFHDSVLGRDASKVALLRLICDLDDGGAELLDVQWATPHLETLGAIEIDRDEYLEALDEALAIPPITWPDASSSRQSGRDLDDRYRAG